MGGGTTRGAALILGGMVVLGFTDNLIRLIADEAGLWQFHALRSAMALVLLGLAAAALGLALRPRRPRAVATRSAVQASAMLLYFGALPVMPIAQVGAALFTAPIWVLLFGALLFGRPIGLRRLGAVALGFAGVLVMLRPDFAALDPTVAMPLAAGALYGLSNLVTREWCAEEPVGALLLGFFAALGFAGIVALGLFAMFGAPPALVAAAPFLVAPWAAPSAALLFWIFLQAFGSLIAVGMIARGYQGGETSALAVFEYAFLLSAGGWAWLIWGEALAPLDFLGIAMIVASGMVIAAAARPGRAAPAAAR